MGEDALEKMKSVNVLATDAMILALDRIKSDSRSQAVRRILAAMIAAHADGHDKPLIQSMEVAEKTSSRSRKTLGMDEKMWRKAIIWIPERMHKILDRHCADTGLRVADLIRGAIIAATETFPETGEATTSAA